jgi:hypothetical protein
MSDLDSVPSFAELWTWTCNGPAPEGAGPSRVSDLGQVPRGSPEDKVRAGKVRRGQVALTVRPVALDVSLEDVAPPVTAPRPRALVLADAPVVAREVCTAVAACRHHVVPFGALIVPQGQVKVSHGLPACGADVALPRDQPLSVVGARATVPCVTVVLRERRPVCSVCREERVESECVSHGLPFAGAPLSGGFAPRLQGGP